MKNKINYKLLIAITMGSVTMNGCASKTLHVIDRVKNKVKVSHSKEVKETSTWKSLDTSKKEDCIDCYSTVVQEPIKKVVVENRRNIDSYEQINRPIDNSLVYKENLDVNKNLYAKRDTSLMLNQNNLSTSKIKKDKTSIWDNLSIGKKEDCVNCYATEVKKPIKRADNANRPIRADEQIDTIENYTPLNEEKKEANANPYLVDNSYKEYNNGSMVEDNNLKVSQRKNIKTSKWKSLNADKKEDCVNCYATVIKQPIKRVAEHQNVNTTMDNRPVYEKKSEEYANPYLADASYPEYNNQDKTLSTNIENGSINEDNRKISSKNSIQVAAFRKYVGAKVYANRYSLLSSKYNVQIKENVKDNKPLFCVQIEGFSNEIEAKKFMESYGLTGAFLVSR